MTPGTTQHCTQCGTQLPVTARFCHVCGSATANSGFAAPRVAPTPPPPPPPPAAPPVTGPVDSGGMTNFTRVRQLFDQAQAIPPEQRESWLVNACQGDAALLTEVRG